MELDNMNNHVNTCEICADTKEGIDAMVHPELLEERVSLINGKVNAYPAQSKTINRIWYWSAAAILIMGVGLSLYLNTKPNTLTKNNKPYSIPTEQPGNKITKKENPAITSPELRNIPLAKNDVHPFEPVGSGSLKIIPPTNAEGARIDNDFQFKSIDLVIDSLKITPIISGTSPQGDTMPRGYISAFEDTKDLHPEEEKEKLRSEETRADDDKTESSRWKQEDFAVSGSVKFKKSVSYSNKRESIPAPSNMSNNNMGNTSNNSVVQYLHSKDSADYEMAKVNYESKIYNQCLLSLAKISNNSNSLFYEDGLFLQAKALIAQGKTKEAKKVLNTLISLKNKRSIEARALLGSLK